MIVFRTAPPKTRRVFGLGSSFGEPQIGSNRKLLCQNRNRKTGDKEKNSSNRANNHISSSEFKTEDSAKQLGTPRILVCPAEHPRQGPGELEAARPE
jgi:hypothetical protein